MRTLLWPLSLFLGATLAIAADEPTSANPSATSASPPAVVNPVLRYCYGKWPKEEELFSNCLKNQVVDAILALPLAERRSFFERLNDDRTPPPATATDEVIATRKCDKVEDAGYMADKVNWAVRCDDGRTYVVQFAAETIYSGLDCFFLKQYFGQSCERATSVLKEIQ